MALSTTPFSAAGTTLGYKIPPASVYTSLLQLIDLEAPSTSIAAMDTTLLASTVKTFIPSIPDNGEVTLSVFYVPGDASTAELETLAATPVGGISWKITLPDGTVTGTTLVFNAFLTAFSPKGFAIDDRPVADVTLKVSGAVVVTPGT